MNPLDSSSRIGGPSHPGAMQRLNVQQLEAQARVAPAGNVQPRLLQKSGREYARILYMLETALSGHHVKVTHVQVWDISQPHVVEQFEREVKLRPGVVPLDSWVDVDSLNASNSEENIFKRSFTFPDEDNGMAFPTGTLRIAPPPSDGTESGLHRFILGQIFTGRAYPKDDPNQKNVVPEGYDSLYLFDSQSLEDDQLLDSYSHEYVLTRPSQVWPQFVVHFTIASLTDEDRARQGRAKAAHHNQNTDVMGDILELLDRKLHWGQDGVRMKLSGVAALQNELSRAADEYNQAIVSSQRRDPTLEGVKSQIKDQLAVLNHKLGQVKKNSAMVEESIYQILQEALFQLQDETQRKLNMLLGDELELRRRFAHIEWSEARLDRNREDMAPPDFVHAWNHHLETRKRMYAYRDMGASILGEVHADINVIGGVQVVVENRSEIGQQGSTGPRGSTDARQGLLRNGPSALDASSEFRKAVFEGNQQQQQQRQQQLSHETQSSASHVVASMRRMVDNSDMDGGTNYSTFAPSSSNVSTSGLGLSSSALPAQDARNWIREKTVGHQQQQQLAPSSGAGAMEGVWMSDLRQKAGVQASPAPGASTNIPRPPPSDSPVQPPTPSSQVATPKQQSAQPVHTPASAGRMERFKKQFSLSTDANRRLRAFVKNHMDGPHMSREEVLAANEHLMFPGSRLLNPTEAQNVYFCLPVRIRGAPNDCSEMIYSSSESGARLSIDAVLQTLPHPEDALENSIGCVFVARSGSYTFGAYSHFGPPHQGLYGGSDKNFLFSVTQDMKIPYHGRRKATKPTLNEVKQVFKELHTHDHEETFPGEFGNGETEARHAAEEHLMGLQKNGWESFFIDNKTIRFGVSDLVFRGDLTQCVSQLEGSFGFGMPNGDAKTLLAGAPDFRVHELEVYLVKLSGDQGYQGGGAYGSEGTGSTGGGDGIYPPSN
jgi:hypothetical protein